MKLCNVNLTRFYEIERDLKTFCKLKYYDTNTWYKIDSPKSNRTSFLVVHEPRKSPFWFIVNGNYTLSYKSQFNHNFYSFEDIFDNVTESAQIEILFNLDIFNSENK